MTAFQRKAFITSSLTCEYILNTHTLTFYPCCGSFVYANRLLSLSLCLSLLLPFPPPSQGDRRRAFWRHCSQGVLQWGRCQVSSEHMHSAANIQCNPIKYMNTHFYVETQAHSGGCNWFACILVSKMHPPSQQVHRYTRLCLLPHVCVTLRLPSTLK